MTIKPTLLLVASRRRFAATRCLVPVLLIHLAAACSGASAVGAPVTPRDGVVQMAVTEAGFEPSSVKLVRGEAVKLIITRKTDKTCAKEIVIDEHAINTPLPLNKAVTVAFTPKKSGQLKFGCAMDKMIGGILYVE